MKMARFDAPASRAAPTANTRAPMATARGRPNLSDKAPAKREAKGAESKRDEMTNPCSADERAPNVSMKEGIVVTGPMVPVSRLGKLIC
jgi:hypothetical protein